MHLSSNLRIAAIVLAVILFVAPLAHADDAPAPLPPAVQERVNMPLEPVGSGTYRKFGFRVYNITLLAKNKNWDPNKPYALKLHYTRDVSKDTLVDTVVDDIRGQNVADENTMARWQAKLNMDLPEVKEDDELIGLCVPGKKSLLFYNGQQIASIDDQQLSKAFFNIWLGDKADEDLRAELLGQQQ